MQSKELRATVELRAKIAKQKLKLLKLEAQLGKKPPKKKKRKRVEKEKEKGADPTEGDGDEPGHIDGPVVTQQQFAKHMQLPPPKKRKVRSAWFHYQHGGQRFKVGDFSRTADRLNYDRMKRAKAEILAGVENGPHYRLVIDILKDGLKRGVGHWMNEENVPDAFLTIARAELKDTLSEEDYDRMIAKDTEESSLSESFAGAFQVSVVLKSTPAAERCDQRRKAPTAPIWEVEV